MLNKVRARSPIDLPVEQWERSWGLTIFIATLAILFMIVPLVVGFLLGLVKFTLAAILGIVSGVLALLLTSLFLNPGYSRHQ